MYRAFLTISISLLGWGLTGCGSPKAIKYYAVKIPAAPGNPSHANAIDLVVSRVSGSDLLEASPIVVKKFEGNICLSNPQYDLYVDYGQIALGDTLSDQRRRMRCLMDFVPALDRPVSVKAVADRVGVSERDTLEYLQRWAAKGLIDLL